jgi:hypothetical protein
MSRKHFKDILSTHADQLLQGHRPTFEDYGDLSVEDRDELSLLFDMVEQIQSTLKPIHPPRRFETNLKKELLATAHLRQTQGYRPPDPARDLLILATVMGFIISLAGVLLVWRLHHQRS